MISDVDDELVALFKQHPNTAVLSALGGPRRAVYAPWLNPVHPLILETVLPEQIKRLQSRFPLTDPEQLARSKEAWDRLATGHRATERRGREDRRRHRWRRPAGRSVHRLDDAHRAREHGDGGHSAGQGAGGGARARRRRSSGSTTWAPSLPARAPTSSSSTPIRSTTSRTRAGSRTCTCAAIGSIGRSCGQASWVSGVEAGRLDFPVCVKRRCTSRSSDSLNSNAS